MAFVTLAITNDHVCTWRERCEFACGVSIMESYYGPSIKIPKLNGAMKVKQWAKLKHCPSENYEIPKA